MYSLDRIAGDLVHQAAGGHSFGRQSGSAAQLLARALLCCFRCVAAASYCCCPVSNQSIAPHLKTQALLSAPEAQRMVEQLREFPIEEVRGTEGSGSAAAVQRAARSNAAQHTQRSTQRRQNQHANTCICAPSSLQTQI